VYKLRASAAAIMLIALAAVTFPIASAPGDFTLGVSPEAGGVLRGESIDYAVAVTSIGTFQGFLTVELRGLPSGSEYSVKPATSFVNPGETINVTVAVQTGLDTPVGSYPLNITAMVSEYSQGIIGTVAHSKTVTLNVLSEMLYITVSTDRKSYNQGDTVKVSGRVVAPYPGVEGAEVSIELIDPNLTQVESTKTYTNREGYYQQDLAIKSDAPQGTYTILVEANKTTFKETRTYATITVGAMKPSIMITSIYITDINGASQTVFKQGAAAIIWIEVTNTGGDLTNGLVWAQIEDPNAATVTVMYQIANIRQGETFKAGFSLTLSQSQTLGQYTAKAFVSDKLIAQGGRFLTPPRQTTFTVTT